MEKQYFWEGNCKTNRGDNICTTKRFYEIVKKYEVPKENEQRKEVTNRRKKVSIHII